MTDEHLTPGGQMQAEILKFIHQELVAPDERVGADDDLLTGELLDSLGILRLATFVDETFSIGMQPSDFLIENFRTVTVLVEFVERTLATRSSSS